MNGPGYQVEQFNDKQMVKRENFQWNLPGETETIICLQYHLNGAALSC